MDEGPGPRPAWKVVVADKVVVEPVEPIGQVVEQGALDVDQVGERIAETGGVVAGIGVRTLGEQESWTLGPGRFRSVAAAKTAAAASSAPNPAWGRASEHLGNDAGQRLGPASLWRPIGDVRPCAMATRDVARIGPDVDRPRGSCWGSL